MPRARNAIPSVTITISTTLQVRRALERLVATGYYGPNPAAAAERLLARVLEDRYSAARLRLHHKARGRGDQGAP